MYPAAVGDEQIIDSVENDTYPEQPECSGQLQPRPAPYIDKSVSDDSAAENVHGSGAKAWVTGKPQAVLQNHKNNYDEVENTPILLLPRLLSPIQKTAQRAPQKQEHHNANDQIIRDISYYVYAAAPCAGPFYRDKLSASHPGC